LVGSRPVLQVAHDLAREVFDENALVLDWPQARELVQTLS
jgi:hypothetical protein